MKARCKMLVELYDPQLKGRYQPDQILEGADAEKALLLYPDYFDRYDGATFTVEASGLQFAVPMPIVNVDAALAKGGGKLSGR